MFKCAFTVLVLLQFLLALEESARAVPCESGHAASQAQSAPCDSGQTSSSESDPCRSDDAGESQQDVLHEADCLTASFDALPREKREKAMKILQSSLPEIKDLDARLSVTVKELEALNYNDDSDPDQLSRLGYELQRLREAIRNKLRDIRSRLKAEAGVSVTPPASRGCRGMRSLYGEQNMVHSVQPQP